MQRLFIPVILVVLLATLVPFSPHNSAISLADTATQNSEQTWIRNVANGHYYSLTEPMPWPEAEAWAQERGGHLVTLRNWEEESWIKDTFGRYEHFWIGFSDIDQEGVWVWSSGEPVVYTNWDKGEPNNCGGFDEAGFCNPEDVAVMNWGSPQEFGDNWNDLPDGRFRGVAEIVPDYVLTVSITAGGSVVTPGEGEFPCKDGMVVDLAAKAEEGYRFVNWTGNATTIANVNAASTTVTINDHYSITANFEPIPEYDLTIASSEGGSVIAPDEGALTYEEGTVVDLEAEPDEGYQFVQWSGDVETVADVEAASTTITMNDDCSIVATFEEIPPVPTGCFIATAAYGTPVADDIQILRECRDEYLLTNPLGQALADIYYSASLPMADFITDHPSLKPIVRAGLMPIVAMCSIVLDVVPQFAGNEAM